MNRIGKIFRLIRFREKVFGRIGRGNTFADGTIVGERAIIGSYNYFGSNSLVANAVIGNFCSIAPSAIIGPADHSKDFVTTYSPISSELIGFEMFHSPAVLGSDVWLGANVVVKQGVRIGNGAIIGANSFVNRDIPPYAIAVGSPARVLRFRFDEDRVRQIEDSAWWERDIGEAKQILRKLMRDGALPD